MDRLKCWYGRISTDELTQGSSIERQTEIGKSLDCDLVLIDQQSGKDFVNRPKYSELINLIRDGRVECVYATRNDRLNRNQIEQSFFYRLCIARDTAWKFTEEPWLNSDNEASERLRKQAAEDAQRESERISFRVKNSNQWRESQGFAVSAKAMLGLRYNRETKGFELNDTVIAKQGGDDVTEAQIAKAYVAFFIDIKTVRGAFLAWQSWLETLVAVDTKRYNAIIKLRRNTLSTWIRNPKVRGINAYGIYKQVEEVDTEKHEIKTKTIRAKSDEIRDGGQFESVITPEQWPKVEALLNVLSKRGAAISRSKNESGVRSLAPIVKCACCRDAGDTRIQVRRKGQKYKGVITTRYYCAQNGGEHVAIKEDDLINQLSDLMICKSNEVLVNMSKKPNTENIDKLITDRRAALDLFESTGNQMLLNVVEDLDTMIRLARTDPRPDPEVMARICDPEFWENHINEGVNVFLLRHVRYAWVRGGKVEDLVLDV